MKFLFAFLLFSALVLPPANQSLRADDDKLSPGEEQEVRLFATQFAADLEKTRNLTPYLTKPPASTLFRMAISDREDQMGFVQANVTSKVGENQLHKFYLALWNVGYLSESYVYGRFLLEKTAIRDLSPSQQYPPSVVKFMKRNPTVNKWWKTPDSSDTDKVVATVGQFRSLLATYDQAAVLLRRYLRSHPPEHTAIYKQNLTYLETFLKEIAVDACDSEKDCAGLPLHTRIIKLNLPVVQLWLVRLDGRLQILLVGLHND